MFVFGIIFLMQKKKKLKKVRNSVKIKIKVMQCQMTKEQNKGVKDNVCIRAVFVYTSYGM